jgi:hypothetical protein
VRSLATRLWHAKKTPSERLRAAAEEARSRLAGVIGRVESAGRFEDAGFEAELKAGLPTVIAAATRPSMEWYGCAGAFFHNDAHYDGVLFGVWSMAGPARELVFSRVGQRLPAAVGSIAVFDPFEPHAVLEAGSLRYRKVDYRPGQTNLFLGFEVELTPAVCDVFGVGPPTGRGVTLSSRIAINPETGALPLPA